MFNIFLKRMFVGLAFLSYAATSVAMEEVIPTNVERIDVKKLLQVAGWYGFDALNFTAGNGRFLYDGLSGIRSLYKKVDD